jgi:hypothetical protein
MTNKDNLLDAWKHIALRHGFSADETMEGWDFIAGLTKTQIKYYLYCTGQELIQAIKNRRQLSMTNTEAPTVY